MSSFIQTYTGQTCEWTHGPEISEVRIEDIAHSLANQCRYLGHTRGMFGLSIAEHSVRVSEQLSDEDAIYGLLHDAHEAYMGDIPGPMKKFLNNAGQGIIDEIEAELDHDIYNGLNIELPTPAIRAKVHTADMRMLMTEATQLLSWPAKPWGINYAPYKMVICDPLPPRAAEELFLQQYELLTKISVTR